MKNKSHENRAALSGIFKYFKPYAGIFLLDLFCAALTTICDLVLPLIVRYITGAAAGNGTVLTISIILRIGILYLVLRVVDTAANYFMQSIGHIMGSRIEADLRRDLYDKYLDLSVSYFDTAKLGQLMSRITADLNDITEFVHHLPEEILIAALKISVSFVILCGTNVLLTVLIFAAVPLMVFFSNLFSRRLRKSFMESRVELGEVNARVEDSIAGIRVVHSFANEDLEHERFAGRNKKFLEIKKRMYFNISGLHSVTRLFDGVMYISVVVIGAIFMIKGEITPFDLIAYLLYVTTLLASIRRLVEFSEQFQRGITGYERFAEVMREPITVAEKPDAVEMVSADKPIEFRDVTFRYDTGVNDVLSHMDLTIRPGESIAVVGPSGGGKTTFCNLIPRMYDVSAGSIQIGGIDVRDFKLRSLRRHIGVVQQEVYIFSGSVLENIEYGRPGASREDIEHAAKMAGADEFIRELENGYDTFIGEHGVRLSGGQKQRISIARIFLKDPQILILDEATSALDNESEHLVQESLEKLSKGRTTITVAHRLTTIRNADRILVLTDEGIAEEGSHKELMQIENGIYRKMYEMYV